jgi:hypothetical protein
MRDPKLKAKVEAKNAVNEADRYWRPRIKDFFREYVGKTVVKADGTTLVKRVSDQLDFLPGTPTLKITANAYGSSLSFEVKTSAMYNDTSCLYETTSIYVGEIKDGVLLNIADAPTYSVHHRSDWTVEEIEGIRAELEEAEKVVSAIKDRLGPFQYRN